MLSLALTDEPNAAAPRRTGRLLVATDSPGSSPGADVPSTVLPLFPSSTTTAATKSGASTPAPPRPTLPASATAPALGTYTFSVSGNESLTGGGSRALPATMRLTAHRAGAGADEVVLDLVFSEQHTQREIVRFGSDRVAFRYDTMTTTIGLATRTAVANYTPTVGRVALPLASSAVISGVSEVRGNNGDWIRTEDWKLTTVGQGALGWEISLERTSRPGASENFRETRRMWFDTTRAIWVKWQTHLHSERSAGGLPIVYDLDYTATLTSFRPA